MAMVKGCHGQVKVGILDQVKEIVNSASESVNSKGILLLANHKVCKGVFMLPKAMSFRKLFMKEKLKSRASLLVLLSMDL